MAEEQAPEQERQAEAPKKGLGAKLPVIGGVVGGLALGAVVGLLVLGPRLAPRSAGAQGAPAAAHAEKKTEGGGKDDKSADTTPIYLIDNLVLNPAGSNGTRFLLVSVALQAKDDNGVNQLKARDAELRDAILRLLGSKTAEQVTEASQRDGIRSEVLTTVNTLVPGNVVHAVFFPQFVVQ